MISLELVVIVSLLYFGLLFAVAYYADWRRSIGRSIISNPYIYALSLGVYMTSWTFYGSVGRAATSGLDFLPVYLGPTLIAFSWWFLLRKMVRISKEQNIVSIADFISGRYGKSASLGAIVTIFALAGIMPYIALQLKAVSYAFDILTKSSATFSPDLHHTFPNLPPFIDTASIVALLLGLFSVLFGARTLDASERHEGLVAAVAFESIVKIIAFLSVGIFVTFGLFNGMPDIFERFRTDFPQRLELLFLDTNQISYSTWFTLTFISMMAFMFLPRQFHIMVNENSNEKHILHAMWLTPACMFLINFFVIPIALGGLILSGGATEQADFFVLQLPLANGHPWLALFVFIGGFSASAGMVMVSSVTLATMILNHLVMPLILRINVLNLADISGVLINIKRLGIMLTIFLGYLYFKVIGESYALVNIGYISFIAATQFAPSVVGGIYWKRANRRGAATGLILGFITWFYTLLIPSFVRSGWLDDSIIQEGPFGLSLLKPLELFGLTGFDIWTHSLFWTLLFNVGAFITLSLFTRPEPSEEEEAHKFVNVFEDMPETIQRKRLSKAPTIVEFVELMTKFIGEKQAHLSIAEYLGEREIDEKGSLSEYELPSLKRFTEKTLAGSVGAAPARIILDNYLATRGSRMEDVFDIFGSVTISRKSSREQLGVLYEAARTVARGDDLKISLDSILDLLVKQFKFDLCSIRILDKEKELLTVRSQKGMTSEHLGESERRLTRDTYIGETFLNNATKIVNDTDFIEKPATAVIIHREGIKSFAHAPITVEGQPIGVLSAFSRSAKGIFTDEFVELFKSLADQVGIAWRNAEQTNALILAKEQEREMQIAKNIQLGLLPTRTPDLPGLSMAGICVPAKQVGGDYYDFLERDSDSVDLVIADVSGHTVGAALLMAETRTFIRSRVHNIESPKKMMWALNNFFYNDLTHSELFITMFYLQYNSRSKVISYANAGHSRPIILRGATENFEWLDAEGLILGVKKEVSYEEKRGTLEKGDVLFLYTDGIIEATNRDDELFGEERLLALLKEFRSLTPSDILKNILDEVRIFGGSQSFADDVSMVVMKIN